MKHFCVRVVALILVIFTLLSEFAAFADYCRVVDAYMPVYSDSHLTYRIGTVKRWTIAVVKSTRSGVAKLNINGKKCFAEVSYLATAHDVSPYEFYGTYRTNKRCKIYCYPSTSAKSITVKKGLLIETIEESGNWILCRSTNGKWMGYIQRKNVIYSD